jgi:hypothetical protein
MGHCTLQEVLATKSGVINLMMLVGFVLMLVASKVVSSPYRLLYASMRTSSTHMAIGPIVHLPGRHRKFTVGSLPLHLQCRHWFRHATQARVQPPDITMMFSQALGSSLFMTVAQNDYKCLGNVA